jgi:hypothetical protein
MSVFSKLDPDIITFHILPYLDGKTLIILSSVSSQFYNLIWKINTNNSDLWRNICISTWPSLFTNFQKQDFHSIISILLGGYRTFFLDAFPSIHPPLNNPLPPLPPKLFFFYAVDIFLHGEQQPFYSLHGAQMVFTYSEYYSHPLLDPPIFKFELCHREAAEMNFIKVKKEGCLEYLKQKLSFNCVAIDPKGIKRAGSLFTNGCNCKAVLAKRVILGVEVLFETVLPVPAGLSNLYTEMIKCRVEVMCRWEGEGEEEDKLRVRFVCLTMKDMNGKPLLERDGAAVILNAIQNGVRRGTNTLTQLVS